MPAVVLGDVVELQPAEIVCIVCRRPFDWSPDEQRFYAAHDLAPPRRCKPCRERARPPQDASGGETRMCRRCFKEFALDSKTRAWFLERGMPLPWKCAPCRRAAREAR
jgi:hypothetical protein